MNIVITGASRGIGFELVKQFSANRYNHILAISRTSGMLPTLSGWRKNINHVECDFSKISSNYLDIALSDWKKYRQTNILINNVGTLINKPFAEHTADDFENLITVNVKSAFMMIQQLLNRFSTPAHILNIGSMAGFQNSKKFAGLSLYSASKGALTILTESLAEELSDRNIHVNMLALGAVDTQMLKEAFPDHKTSLTAAEIAKFAISFAIDGLKLFNGRVIPVSASTP